MAAAARDARWTAAAAHLSAIPVAAVTVTISRSALVAVIVAPAGPLVVAPLTRRAQPFVSRHAREAVRFTLSVSFYATGVALGLTATARFDAVPKTRSNWLVGVRLPWTLDSAARCSSTALSTTSGYDPGRTR